MSAPMSTHEPRRLVATAALDYGPYTTDLSVDPECDDRLLKP